MRVAAFKTTCLNCNNIFSCPKLSDFNYGDTIFNCECGKEFVCHSMIAHPVTVLFELLCHIYKIEKNNNSLRDFSAFFADTSHFHHFKAKEICPECKSESLSFDESEKMSIFEIEVAAYTKLYSLSKEELFKEFGRYLAIHK